ncbi:MAG: Gfo/Idh/MocA family oxidoreductase [Acidimicrobiales bacterium]
MRLAVLGAGAVGSRAARQLASTPGVEALTIVDPDPRVVEAVCASLGPVATGSTSTGVDLAGHDVVVLAGPGKHHRDQAERSLKAGASVVSCTDELAPARLLLALDDDARARDRSLVVGAGFAPGLSDLLAAHAGSLFDDVHEVHVARSGTGGPACARAHHASLRGLALDWRDGAWVSRQGGSGRELAWFPDPVAGQDCYRASLPDALLFGPAFPGMLRATSRVAATRRDRLTAPLPMLRQPHPEGLVGAIRVEVRGRRGQAVETVVYGAVDRPALAAGAVAAVVAVAAAAGQAKTGAAGVAVLLPEPLPLLQELADRGIRCATFAGSA